MKLTDKDKKRIQKTLAPKPNNYDRRRYPRLNKSGPFKGMKRYKVPAELPYRKTDKVKLPETNERAIMDLAEAKRERKKAKRIRDAWLSGVPALQLRWDEARMLRENRAG